MKEHTSQKPISVLYVCAVRYALGRQSYMPSLVAQRVVAGIDDISANDRRVIARDIRHELGLRADLAADDVKGWRRALEALDG